jgi:hypothetical protein
MGQPTHIFKEIAVALRETPHGAFVIRLGVVCSVHRIGRAARPIMPRPVEPPTPGWAKRLYLAGSLQVLRRPHEQRAGVDCYGRTATRLPYRNRCRLFSTSLPPLARSPRRAGQSPPFSLAWQRRVALRCVQSRSRPLLLLLWLCPKQNRLPLLSSRLHHWLPLPPVPILKEQSS